MPPLATDAREPRSDHRGEDRDAAERERVQREVRRLEVRAEQHHRDGGHRVRLEEVGRHARAVADVVADVVRDHGRVARIVLGDAGLDLPDEVGADVGGLGVDAAAETREDRDERAAEREPDQVVDRGVLRVVQPVGEHPVVAGDAEQAEADDEQARHRAGAERDVESRRETVARRLGGANVRAHGDVHADEARRRGEHGADEEAEGRPPAELVVEAEDEERDDRDGGDGDVLAPEIGRSAFLDGARDLAHSLVPGGLLEHPVGQPDAVRDGERRRK